MNDNGNWSPRLKWLVSVLGGLLILFQAWNWLESRIEKRCMAEVNTANALTRLEASVNDTKTWLDGRVNTLSSRLDAVEREMTLLRQPRSEVTPPR